MKTNALLLIIITYLVYGCSGENPLQHDHVYVFPYEHGVKYQLSQGFNGTLSHHGKDAYSLDFDMPVGSVICAARSGVVHSVKEDSDKGGGDEKFKDYGNEIVIDHEDGTYGLYCHLRKNGAIVEKGDKVITGQEIGYSGNTGFSTGPHLHFSVIRYKEEERRTLLFKVLDHNHEPVEPVEGWFYYSTHPDLPLYKIELGHEIDPKDLAGESRAWENNGKCNMYVEQVDNTVILWFRNGRKKKVSVELKADIVNLISSKELPFTEIVPPLSETFLLLLRQDKARKAWRYNYRFSFEEVN